MSGGQRKRVSIAMEFVARSARLLRQLVEFRVLGFERDLVFSVQRVIYCRGAQVSAFRVFRA